MRELNSVYGIWARGPAAGYCLHSVVMCGSWDTDSKAHRGACGLSHVSIPSRSAGAGPCGSTSDPGSVLPCRLQNFPSLLLSLPTFHLHSPTTSFYNSLYSFIRLFKKLFFHLLQSQKERRREGESDLTSIGFTPQMFGPGGSQEPGARSWSLLWMAEATCVSHDPLLCKLREQEAGPEVEEWRRRQDSIPGTTERDAVVPLCHTSASLPHASRSLC